MRLLILLLFPMRLLAQTPDTLTIYFEVNEAWPSTEELQKIQYDTSWKKVEIYAYTDLHGSEQFNQKLSEKRALFTRAHLLNKGCPASTITTYTGKGISNKSQHYSKNRRADIIVYQQIQLSNSRTTITLPKTKQPAEKPPVSHIEEASLAKEINAAIAGESIILKNLSFVPGTHRLEDTSYPSIDTLIAIMYLHPSLKIAIEGHICCVDIPKMDGLNLLTGSTTLSEDRARYIYTLLKNFGIEKERMTYKGLAKTKPLFPDELNSTEEQANRRVEIIILEK